MMNFVILLIYHRQTQNQCNTIVVEKWVHCKVIFFTAHSDFEYAYYASKYNNTKIVLKSEGFESVLKLIDDSVQQIKKDLLNQELLTDIYDNDGDVNFTSQSPKIFNNLITHTKDSLDKFKEFYDKYDIKINLAKQCMVIRSLLDKQPDSTQELKLI